MELNIELIDIFIVKKGRSWLSLLQINNDKSLLYIEWGQYRKIQIGLLFGLIKNY